MLITENDDAHSGILDFYVESIKDSERNEFGEKRARIKKENAKSYVDDALMVEFVEMVGLPVCVSNLSTGCVHIMKAHRGMGY